MCVVSMIGDHYKDKWDYRPYTDYVQYPSEISRQEFEALKQEVLEMKKLLERALEYDKKNGEPHCEIDEKVALLKRMAEIVGVDLNELLRASD